MKQASIGTHVETVRFWGGRNDDIGALAPSAGILLGLAVSVIMWQALVLAALWLLP